MIPWNYCRRLQRSKEDSSNLLTSAQKTAVEDIVKDLKSEFKTMLKGLEAWMDPKTRAEAEKKVDKMGSSVAYPKEFLDDDRIIQFYSDLKMKKKDSFLLKGVTLSKFLKKKKAEELRL